jgi:hypothetical protein
MNRWFEEIAPLVTVDTMSVGDALHVLAGKLQPVIVLKGMDYPHSFDTRNLRKFRDAIFSLPGPIPPIESTLITVSDRIRSDDFFHQPGAEVPMSGAERRSVPNLQEATAALEFGVDISYFDSSDLSPLVQVHAHSQSRILIGQHGAGLTNMIWMQPGSTVIEIHPPLPAEAVHTFERLAKALGHHYELVVQETVHSSVDAELLRLAVERSVDRY